MRFEDRTNKIEKKGPLSSFVSFVNLVAGHGPKIEVAFVYLLDSVHSFYGDALPSRWLLVPQRGYEQSQRLVW